MNKNDQTIEDAFKEFTSRFDSLFNLHRPKKGPRIINNYAMHKAVEDAEKTSEYDPSFLTALSYLELKFHEGLREINYSLDAIVFNPKGFEKEKSCVLEMQQILDSCSEYVSQKNYFINIVADLAANYETDKTFSVEKILQSRYSALCSFDYLQDFQFLRGEEDTTPPKYIKQVYEWWNINSLIDYATTLPNSISLHLIRHPNLYESYFCFLIKRGGNIFIFTDKMNLPTPSFSMTTRRPDRLMAENIDLNYFPYYLLKIESENGDLFETKTEASTDLVAFQKKTFILTTISELREDSLLWVILMFDLINQNYFLNHKQLEELSFTVEMMVQPQRFIEKTKTNGVVAYSNIEELEHITTASIHSDNIDSSALGREFTSNWMEDRYSSQITDEMLNQVQPIGQNTYFNTANQSLVCSEKSKSDLVGYFKENDLVSLASVHPTQFNTGKQIRLDRIFMARLNYVNLIEELASNEFSQRKPEIKKWFEKICQSKNTLIIDRCKQLKTKYELKDGALNRIDGLSNSITPRSSRFSTKFEPTRSVFVGKGGIGEQINGNELKSLSGNNGHGSCYLTDAASSYAAVFSLADIADILDFFDIKLKDVPEFMHHYTSRNYRSQGNSILNRTDPMADIRNPFHHYSFTVIVYLSKRGYSKL